jgi:excisionase family DNA binding protein
LPRFRSEVSKQAVATSPESLHPRSPAADWLSLGPAARLVGVDPDTLRRWADAGRIDVFTTPGGHRRFDRRAIERLRASRHTPVQPLASLGATPERLSRAYRRSYGSQAGAGQLAPGAAADREAYRQDGRRLVEALIAHLDADPGNARVRARAEAAAAEIVDDMAERLARHGVVLAEAVGQFVAARRPFLTELAGIGRRRTSDPAHLASLYEDASAVLDRLLLRFIAAHEAASA